MMRPVVLGRSGLEPRCSSTSSSTVVASTGPSVQATTSTRPSMRLAGLLDEAGELLVVHDERGALALEHVGQLGAGEAGVEQQRVGAEPGRRRQRLDEAAVVAAQDADGVAGRVQADRASPTATASQRCSSSAQVSSPRSSTRAVPLGSRTAARLMPGHGGHTLAADDAGACGGTCRGAAARPARCAPGCAPATTAGRSVAAGSSQHREAARCARSSSASCIRSRTTRSTSTMSGSSPNSSRMSIGSSTRVSIFVGSGRFGGNASVRPNGKPKVTGMYFVRSRFSSPNTLRDAARRGERWIWSSWPPMLTDGHDRDVGLESGADVAHAAVEVDLVALARRPERVVVAAREHDRDPALAQHRGRVRAAGRHEARAPHRDVGQPGEQQVVREAVDRPLVAEVVEERDREHRHVHGDQPAGVVGHHQRAALGDVLDAVHLRAEPELHDHAQHRHQPRDELAVSLRVAHVLIPPPLRAGSRPTRTAPGRRGPGRGGRRPRRAPAGWRPGRCGC